MERISADSGTLTPFIIGGAAALPVGLALRYLAKAHTLVALGGGAITFAAIALALHKGSQPAASPTKGPTIQASNLDAIHAHLATLGLHVSPTNDLHQLCQELGEARWGSPTTPATVFVCFPDGDRPYATTLAQPPFEQLSFTEEELANLTLDQLDARIDELPFFRITHPTGGTVCLSAQEGRLLLGEYGHVRGERGTIEVEDREDGRYISFNGETKKYNTYYRYYQFPWPNPIWPTHIEAYLNENNVAISQELRDKIHEEGADLGDEDYRQELSTLMGIAYHHNPNPQPTTRTVGGVTINGFTQHPGPSFNPSQWRFMHLGTYRNQWEQKTHVEVKFLQALDPDEPNEPLRPIWVSPEEAKKLIPVSGFTQVPLAPGPMLVGWYPRFKEAYTSLVADRLPTHQSSLEKFERDVKKLDPHPHSPTERERLSRDLWRLWMACQQTGRALKPIVSWRAGTLQVGSTSYSLQGETPQTQLSLEDFEKMTPELLQSRIADAPYLFLIFKNLKPGQRSDPVGALPSEEGAKLLIQLGILKEGEVLKKGRLEVIRLNYEQIMCTGAEVWVEGETEKRKVSMEAHDFSLSVEWTD